MLECAETSETSSPGTVRECRNTRHPIGARTSTLAVASHYSQRMPTWTVHVFGNIGVVMILVAYFLVSTGRMKSMSPRYQVLNLVGAAVLVVYSIALAAWASVALNAIWAVIALVSLVRLRTRPPVES